MKIPPINEENIPTSAADHICGKKLICNGATIVAHCGNDAAKWAAEFIRVIKLVGTNAIDESFMIGWFANAIESRPESVKSDMSLLINQIDVVMRHVADEILLSTSSNFVRELRISELNKLVALRDELSRHGAKQSIDTESLKYRVQKIVDADKLIQEEQTTADPRLRL